MPVRAPSGVRLGKLIAIFPTSPVHVQRAAIVALLAFFFFAGMLVVFLIRQHFMYLILAAAFLLVNLFTLIGFFVQRRNAVRVFENGLSFGKHRITWAEITAVRFEPKKLLEIETVKGTLVIPRSIDRIDQLADHLNSLTRRTGHELSSV